MINYMNDSTFILILFFAMIVTYIPRMLPLVILSKTKLPIKVERFLDYIPIAILGSILLPTLIYKEEQINISFDNEMLIAGIITIIVAKFVKRVDVIVITGILVTVALRMIMK